MSVRMCFGWTQGICWCCTCAGINVDTEGKIDKIWKIHSFTRFTFLKEKAQPPSIALWVSGYLPIKNNQLWSVRSQCTLVVESWNFLCRFQNGMALFGNFFGPLHYVLHGEKIWNATSAGLQQSRLVPKNHKKLNKNCHNFFVCCKVAKMGENGFFLNLKIIFCIFLLIFWWVFL